MNPSLDLHKQSTMQLAILFTLIIGACNSAPSDLFDGNSDKINPMMMAESSSLQDNQADIQPDYSPKHSCSIFDPILIKNCSDEAAMYLDEARKSCCTILVQNNCKIRLLKQVCSAEEYAKKVASIEANSNFAYSETPDCPSANYDKSYCDLSTIESLTGIPQSWAITGFFVVLGAIVLLAVIFAASRLC